MRHPLWWCHALQNEYDLLLIRHNHRLVRQIRHKRRFGLGPQRQVLPFVDMSNAFIANKHGDDFAVTLGGFITCKHGFAESTLMTAVIVKL
jgi:hypothetical protein